LVCVSDSLGFGSFVVSRYRETFHAADFRSRSFLRDFRNTETNEIVDIKPPS
jgi:hypothetical protein